VIYDVIVIGGGPAGVAASSYCDRKGLKTLMIYDLFGGQINYTDRIHSLPSAPAINSKELISLYDKTAKHVIKIKEHVLGIAKNNKNFLVRTKVNEYRGKTIIAATGRSPLPLELGNQKSFDYLTFEDYPFSKIKPNSVILIIGGGYCGLDISKHLSSIAKKITIIEKSNELGGNHYRQQEILKRDNVQIYFNALVVDIEQQVAKIKTKNEMLLIAYDYIIVTIGDKPNSGIYDSKLLNGQFEISIKRNINAKFMNMSTKVEGLFAAGDVATLNIFGFVATAEASGIEAALSAYRYLKGKGNVDGVD